MPNYDGINYLIEPISKEHKRDNFDCGIEILNSYLKTQANQDKCKFIAAPFIAIREDNNEIIGYYTLSATSIKLEDLPVNLMKKLPKYPILPAILLGRLAIDKKYQNSGWGKLLLMSALYRSLNNEIAAMAMVVSAINDQAMNFYKKYHFIPFDDYSNRLFLPMLTIKQIFD
jgi:predicted GNAT family N-acyltransferase